MDGMMAFTGNCAAFGRAGAVSAGTAVVCRPRFRGAGVAPLRMAKQGGAASNKKQKKGKRADAAGTGASGNGTQQAQSSAPEKVNARSEEGVEVGGDDDFVPLIAGDRGVLKRTLRAPDDAAAAVPQQGQRVAITYTARLYPSGEVVDSMQDPAAPYVFELGAGKVVRAWEVGVAAMQVGEQATFRCAPEYTFEDKGLPPQIPPGATLEFDIELLTCGGDQQTEEEAGAYGAPSIKTYMEERDFAKFGVTDDVDDEDERRRLDISAGVENLLDPFEADRAKRLATKQQINQDVVVTEDNGVLKRILSTGRGELVANGAEVRVNYIGRLPDAENKVFDSSYDRGKPFTFRVGTGKVIRGWDEALLTMKEGEKCVLTIRPEYAYGSRGVPPVIPPNAVLEFEMEVLQVEMVKENRTFADNNPSVPRTPSTISKAYTQKIDDLQAAKDRGEKVSFWDRFYFISPFQSATGEKPPWWLDPRITFTLAFALLGLAFYIHHLCRGCTARVTCTCAGKNRLCRAALATSVQAAHAQGCGRVWDILSCGTSWCEKVESRAIPSFISPPYRFAKRATQRFMVEPVCSLDRVMSSR
ncbi:FK506-binding protein 1A [Porphyridium purpureum]|uniref:peptidylprolyl isomerase n=1 Tax=Porphyridium purpureum TaxID=35688 RepID=A0A5J4YTZ8_PORPP|nr:FK506-binding protein 1A [Porphyridium purpureum]|eukprot:POR2158..scf229_5